MVQTDSNGQYSMPCANQPLMASDFVPMLHLPGQPNADNETDLNFYSGDVHNEFSPSSLGYVFSGGAQSVDGATVVPCGTSPVNFQLPLSGRIHMNYTTIFTTTTTSPLYSPDWPGDVYWKLIYPGLASQEALSGVGYVLTNPGQTFYSLNPGDAVISGSFMACSGPGVAGSPDSWSVLVQAGQTTQVTCQHEVQSQATTTTVPPSSTTG